MSYRASCPRVQRNNLPAPGGHARFTDAAKAALNDYPNAVILAWASRVGCLFFLLLATCAPFEEPPSDKAVLTPASFACLDGWSSDNPAEALKAFQRSCAKISRKPAWKPACEEASQTPSSDEAARAFFEKEFQPYAVSGQKGEAGLFTGYYMPELNGSLRRGGKYQTPLYARPKDLIDANLGAFNAGLKGQKIVGKVRKNALVPYDDRASIAKGALAARAKPLVWVDDPIDAFFLEIQGSGRVRLKNGECFSLGYDSANGRAYTPIGRILADRGLLARPVTMDAIRAYLSAHPSSSQEIMNLNASAVFFRRLPGDDAIGAMGIGLTPGRSLAVDPRHVPLGAPVWLETSDGAGASFSRLMIAQDTGGAIKGVVRGDVFWGAGPAAAAQAGAMQNQGRIFVLLPKTAKPDVE